MYKTLVRASLKINFFGFIKDNLLMFLISNFRRVLNVVCPLTRPHPVNLLPIGSGYYRAKPSPL
jgi:hypothetical protein